MTTPNVDGDYVSEEVNIDVNASVEKFRISILEMKPKKKKGNKNLA